MSNKENVRVKSKIPVLVGPFPTKEGCRNPLQPLSSGNLQESQPGPSGVKRDLRNAAQNEKVSHQKRVVQAGPSGLRGDMPDMRYVTCGRGDQEALEHWCCEVHKVFGDVRDPVAGAAMPAVHQCNNQNPSTKEPFVATPVAPEASASASKKTKKSLKRAHTKDTQGVTPPTLKVVKKGQVKGTSHGCDWPPVYADEYVMDNLNYLLSIEKRYRGNSTIARASRCCIVNWIVNVNGSTGNPAVVQLACWYMDTYLNRAYVPLVRLQLVAAACYWIAAKVHGVGVTSARLERWSAFAFTTLDLANTEMHVLKELEFPRVPAVAHDFIPYLCCWCSDASGAIAAGASFIALCVTLVHKFGSEFPPSVVAAACVRSALRLTGRSSLIPHLEACPVYESAVKKARDFRAVSVTVRNAVRTVVSRTFEYKAPFNKYSGPPHYAAARIAEAVACTTLVRED